MPSNTEIIDQVVDPKIITDFEAAQAAAAALGAEFITLAKTAATALAATGNAKNLKEFNAALVQTSANTEKLLTLQAKRAKADADAAKSAIALTQAQYRQTQATQRTAAAAQKALSPYEQLNKEHIALRNAARDLGAQLGTESTQFAETAAAANALDARLKNIDSTLGQSQRNVGNYASGFGGIYSLIRQAAFILPGIGVAGIFGKLFEGIEYGIKQLNVFNPLLSETAIRTKAFKDAFGGNEYTEAFKSLEQLKVDVDLASKGFLDKGKVIDEYNKTLGEAYGRVDTLDQAEQGLVAHSDAFIKATLQKAAANIILNDAAKAAADTAKKNQELQDFIISNQSKINAYSKLNIGVQGNANSDAASVGVKGKIDDLRRQIDAAGKEIDANNKEFEGSQKNRLKQIAELNKTLAGGTGSTSGTGSGVSDVDQLKETVANAGLERRKKLDEDIFNNEKLSFAKRISAIKDFYDAERTISENAKATALKDAKDSPLQQQQIFNKFDQDRLDRQVAENEKIRQLQDQQAKLRTDNLKKDLDAQKQAAKQVIDDPASSLDAHLDALDKYSKKSQDIITATNAEQVRDAGNVSEKLAGIAKDTAAARLAVTIDYTAQETKIFQQEQDKQIAAATKHDKKVITQIKSASEQQQQDIADSQSAQLDFAAEQRAKGLISERAYQFQVLNIQHEANLAQLREKLDTAQKLLDLEQKANPDNPDIPAQQKAVSDAKNAIDKENTSFKLKQFKTEDDARKELANNEIQLAEQTAQAIKNIVDGAYQSRIDAIEKQKQALSDAADLEKSGIERSLDTANNKAAREAVIDAQTKARQEELTKEQNKLKRNQAIADKAANVATAAGAAAVAEVQALTYLSNPITAPFYPSIAATIAGLFAIQLATIIATPLPAFAKGVKGFAGGAAIVGEQGAELLNIPGSGTYLSPATSTLLNLPKGTDVYTANQTRKMVRPEVLNYHDGKTVVSVNLDPLLKATRENKPVKQKQTHWTNQYRIQEFKEYRNRRFK